MSQSNKHIIAKIDNRILAILSDMNVLSPIINSYGMGSFLPLTYTAPLLWVKHISTIIRSENNIKYAYLEYSMYFIDDIGDSTSIANIDTMFDMLVDNYQYYLEFTVNGTPTPATIITGKGATIGKFELKINLNELANPAEDPCGCDIITIEGQRGMSAYEVWLSIGNTGTEQDFLDSLGGSGGGLVDWSNLVNVPSTFPPSAHTHTISNITGLQSALDAITADAFSGDYNDLTNLPTLFSGSYTDLTNVPTTFTPSAHTHTIADVTGLQSALNGKQPILPAGTNGQYLKLVSGNPVWATIPATDWADITNKPTFSTVATSGSYNDLSNLPTLFSGDYNDLSNLPTLFSGSYNDLTDLPTLFSGDYNDLTNTPSFAAVALSGDFNDLINTPAGFSGDYNDLTNLPTLFSGSYLDLSNVPSTFAPSAHTHVIGDVTGLQTALDSKEPTITGGTTSQYWRGDKTWQTLAAGNTGSIQMNDGSGNLIGDNNLRYDSIGGLVSVPGFYASDGAGNYTNFSIYDDGLGNIYGSIGGAGTVSTYLNLTNGGGLDLNGVFANFDLTALTGNQTFAFPDTSGTLATEDYVTTTLSGFEPVITAGTTSQYWRGDKTWQTLDKTAVGLGNVDNTSDANKPVSTATQTALNLKQDSLGSGTDGYVLKLVSGSPVWAPESGITTVDWSDITNIPSFATVATSGSYNDLLDLPTLFSGSYNDLTDTPTLATVATTGDYDDLINLPTLFSGDYNDLLNLPTLFSGSYLDLTDVPSTFTPSAHTHAMSDITGLSAALAGKEPTITAGTTGQYWRGDKTWQTLDKTAVGLSNVQNVDQTNAINLTSGSIPTGRYGTGTIPMSAFDTTGTADNTTFLRGDGAWTTINVNPTLQDVLDANNTATGDLTVTNLNGTGYVATPQYRVIGSGFASFIAANLLTGSRSMEMPDYAGTLTTEGYVLSQIAAITVPDIDTVLQAGATSLNKQLIMNQTSDNGAYVVQRNGTVAVNIGQNAGGRGYMALTNTGNGVYATYGHAGITFASGTIALSPGNTGTIAVTSDIPTYSGANGITLVGTAITGINAAADGTTKGVATFASADFDASSGLITLKSDVTRNAATQTLTNKTISGTSNTITNLNGSNISSGTVAAARLGSGTTNSTTYLRGDSTWQTLNGTAVGLGNVVNVDQTNASNLSSGTVGTARLGSGTANSTTFLRGDSTWQSIATTVQAQISTTDNQLTYSAGVINTKKTNNALTDGATITWNMAVGTNASVTLGGNRTLAISNAQSGDTGTIVVTQDGTGSRTLTLPAGSLVAGNGSGVIPLTTVASAKDVLTFYYNGTNYFWTYGLRYS